MPDELDRLIAALQQPAAASSDFDLNSAVVLPPGRVLRPAAVLIALCPSSVGLRVILTVRASHLKHHPGQIALPGGKLDDGDSGPEAAALREAWEEIGLEPGNVRILGQLPPHETVTGFSVTPVLAAVKAEFAFRLDPGEVEEVFTTPLSHVLDRNRYVIEKRLWRGAWRRYYAVPWGPYYIWGATARMLHGLAERVGA